LQGDAKTCFQIFSQLEKGGLLQNRNKAIFQNKEKEKQTRGDFFFLKNSIFAENS
jgi:hypothetical protein